MHGRGGQGRGGELLEGKPKDLLVRPYLSAVPNDEISLERVREVFEARYGCEPEEVVWYLGCPWVGPVPEGRVYPPERKR